MAALLIYEHTIVTANDLSNDRAQAVVTPLFGGDFLVTGGFGFSAVDPIAVGQGEVYVRHRR